MAYEKYTWQNGEVITAEKLNHIEGGVDANSLVIPTFTSDNEGAVVCSHTYAELVDAADSGKLLVCKHCLSGSEHIWEYIPFIYPQRYSADEDPTLFFERITVIPGSLEGAVVVGRTQIIMSDNYTCRLYKESYEINGHREEQL